MNTEFMDKEVLMDLIMDDEHGLLNCSVEGATDAIEAYYNGRLAVVRELSRSCKTLKEKLFYQKQVGVLEKERSAFRHAAFSIQDMIYKKTGAI